jgi:flagellar biosynthetic protein FlhB
VEEGQSIPYELYAAVAAILAYLFRESQEEAAREAKRAAQRKREAKAAVRPMMRGFEGGM